MKTIELLKRLERYPVFTENDVAKVVYKSPKYVRTLLYRLHKSGHIRRIEKGKYTLHEDPLIFSSHIVLPSYLSVWTALRHYNMTEQQPFSVFVVTAVQKQPIRFGNADIRFMASKLMFGFRKERYSDFDIFIADREKTVIDSLLFKLPLPDIVHALEDSEINCQRLVEYAGKTGNKSLMKRLGYLLEKTKGNAYGLSALDNNYVRLDCLGRKRGKKDRKWKLILNDNKEGTS
ncbi:MAG TPA: hypothetical protein VI934_03805 [Candidatus Nanoarchaeia archaeon]|nr:hypothetical protein [Candidatus Nanoarchaeia archaeon]